MDESTLGVGGLELEANVQCIALADGQYVLFERGEGQCSVGLTERHHVIKYVCNEDKNK